MRFRYAADQFFDLCGILLHEGFQVLAGVAPGREYLFSDQGPVLYLGGGRGYLQFTSFQIRMQLLQATQGGIGDRPCRNDQREDEKYSNQRGSEPPATTQFGFQPFYQREGRHRDNRAPDYGVMKGLMMS